MDIGLFTTAAGTPIPADVGLVRTSGYSQIGRGDASYRHLPGRGIEGQTATRFTAADGRVFGIVTDRDVGVDEASADPAVNVTDALQSAFNAFDFTGRTSPPGHFGYGVGAISLPRGNFTSGTTFQPYAALGTTIAGQGRFVSAITSELIGGTALRLQGYGGVTLSDFSLEASATTAYSQNSIGLDLVGQNGGGFLNLNRVDINGYDRCIRNSFNGNGDKTLLSQAHLVGNYGYDNTGNTQAISWTFLNCAGSSSKSQYRLGGCGMTVMMNDVVDLRGSYISYPEGSGNPGSANWTGSTLVIGTKLEQHGVGSEPGRNMLLDASQSRLNTDAGGSNVDLTLLDVHVTGAGNIVADPDNMPVIVVGEEYDGNRGSDAVRVKAWGGWVRGVIKLCSQHVMPQSRRWSFERMLRAPLPEKVQFLGEGNHYLLEWRANENVPVDQYRGGQSFIGSIDAEKAFLWHPQDQPNQLMRSYGSDFTGPSGAIPSGQTRYGQKFAVAGFPTRCSFSGLGVFVESNPAGGDTLVEWFADAAATQLIGSMNVPGSHVGLRRMKPNEIVGALPVGSTTYVRMSKVGGGQITYGGLVLFYFPFMGVS